MKKNKNVLKLIIVYVCMLNSCYNNAFNEILFRNINDPFDDVPKADSLSKEHTVYLSWQEDDAADKYYLMRSFDNTSNWDCIYTGNETSFIDKELEDNTNYIYRLDKTRGIAYFTGKDYAFGWSSETIRDYCEPNNVLEEATFLEFDRICNLPCVTYQTKQKTFLDEDWFYVTIPPTRTAEIIISQKNLINTTEGAPTNLKIQILEESSNSVKHQKAHQIKNPSNKTKSFYFKIFPETTGLFSSGTVSTVIEYTVSLNQIIKYQ